MYYSANESQVLAELLGFFKSAWVAWAVLAYLMAYVLASCQWVKAVDELLSPFRLVVIAKEIRGLVARFVVRTPYISTATPSFNVIGARPTEATSVLLRKLKQTTQSVTVRTWVYTPSQQKAFAHHKELLTDFLVRRMELEALKGTAIPSKEELDWMAKASRISKIAFEQARKASAHDSKVSVASATYSQWRQVLGLAAFEVNRDVIKAAYRKLAAKAHPDRGGSASDMARLNAAMEQARKELHFI